MAPSEKVFPKEAPGWIVGPWDKIELARAAHACLLVANRRGLSIKRAIEFALESADCPVLAAIEETDAIEWMSETYGLYPPRGWSAEIVRHTRAKWVLKVQKNKHDTYS